MKKRLTERFAALMARRQVSGVDLGETSKIPAWLIYKALAGREHPAILFHDAIVKKLNLSSADLRWLLGEEEEKL